MCAIHMIFQIFHVVAFEGELATTPCDKLVMFECFFVLIILFFTFAFFKLN